MSSYKQHLAALKQKIKELASQGRPTKEARKQAQREFSAWLDSDASKEPYPSYGDKEKFDAYVEPTRRMTKAEGTSSQVRSEARHALLAYALLRGRWYWRVEKKVAEGNHASARAIADNIPDELLPGAYYKATDWLQNKWAQEKPAVRQAA